MKVFITGGTGFIGSQVVRRLVVQGHEVVCLARSVASARRAVALGAATAWGDVLEPEGLAAPMVGADLVIHLAGLYRLGDSDWPRYEATNVGGTANVLKTAIALDIPRIIYISSIALYGDTYGKLAVEETRMRIGQPFLSAYDKSKWLAYHKVVQPLVMRGAPIITVIPSAVFGPGDTSLVGQLMHSFLQGWLVLFPGPETLISLTSLEDAVDGILLAAKQGQPGRAYILSGETVTLAQVCRLWVQLTGWPAPRFYVPARLIHHLEGLARLLQSLLPGWPEILTPGAIRVLGASYAGRSDRARLELGWQPQPLETRMRQTLDWMKAQPGMPRTASEARHRHAGGILLLAGLAALPFGLLMGLRKRRPSKKSEGV